ncbi:ketoacyl-ACP synthase III family protein [Nocardia terpenica]|uniref:Uncharacterized protein n=1 Tax=Nocardia terpenica TaxID=455432 RepID=A0A6G9YZA9_9NOCA|nr:ketoacyl-ACP synthase III family protein [Nocardia terpenica]QIS18457.1 hypothetical protein F6W96_09340 [Nocardia terpenica]
MKFESDIWIRSVAAWFPPRRETAAGALAAGRIDADSLSQTGIVAVHVAEDTTAPEMAVRAANIALERAECKPDEVDVLIHAWIYYQGYDLWSPPHYIANQLGTTSALPMSVHQGCDGGAIALQQAAIRLAAVPGERTALITAADRFAEPAIDRWNCQRVLVLGDSGTAIVLSTSGAGPTPFRLEAMRTRTTVEFEVMSRGFSSFSDYPLAAGIPLDGRFISDEGLARVGNDAFYATARSQVRTLILETLEEAGLTDIGTQLHVITLPRLGNASLEAIYYPVVESFIGAQKIRFDAMTGHLACCDLAADMNDLYENSIVPPGKYAAMITVGGGMTWACAVLRACEY